MPEVIRYNDEHEILDLFNEKLESPNTASPLSIVATAIGCLLVVLAVYFYLKNSNVKKKYLLQWIEHHCKRYNVKKLVVAFPSNI